MRSIADNIKAFDLLPKDNSKFEGFQHDQVCILGDNSGYCEKMELRSGKTNGRKTSQAIIVVIQGKEDGSLYQGIASMDGNINPEEFRKQNWQDLTIELVIEFCRMFHMDAFVLWNSTLIQ